MAPKAKPTPHRLGPPPQLNSLKVPVVHQKFAKKVQPKLQEVVSRHIKILAKWFHTQFSWKKFLMSWMVLLIASKMVLLMLTYQFFTMTSLVSLEVRPVVIISYFFFRKFQIHPRTRKFLISVCESHCDVCVACKCKHENVRQKKMLVL